jgi:predicted dehydrogenase
LKQVLLTMAGHTYSASVAVVGCGHWGKNLVRNFSALGALGAVVDNYAQTAEKFATQYNVPALSLAEALASKHISAFVIASPAEVHAQIALDAIKAGKDVYVEKPLALNLADANAIADAARQAGRVLMVGHLLRYHPAFEALLASVQAGELGALQYAYSNRVSTGIFRVEENALWSLAPHDFSLMLALFGEAPDHVEGSGAGWVTPGIEDEFRVNMTFPSGGRAHIFASWLHPFKEQRLVVVGEKAMAVFEDTHPDKAQKLRIYRHGIDRSSGKPVPVKAEAEILPYDMAAEPLAQECKHFLECCDQQISPRTDAAEALAVLRAMIMASNPEQK